MKHRFTLLFALLCASMMGFAAEWTGQVTGTATNVWLDGIGSNESRTEVNYTVNYLVEYNAGTLTITLGYTEDNFNKTVGLVPQVFVNGAYKGNFGGVTWSSTEFASGQVLVIHFFFAYDGGSSNSSHFSYTIPSDGGGEGTEPEPGVIDWSSISWLENGADKYKLVIEPAIADDFGGKRINEGNLWVGFPSAAFGTMSIEPSGGEGAWRTFALSNFLKRENKFTVVCEGTTYTFTVYYADGQEGSVVMVPEIYDVNFALASNGSKATASSGNADAAIDGNDGTRWESAQTDDETYTLDMGQLRVFNTVKINWEGAYCSQFELTYSTDGVTYLPLYTETNLTSAGWQMIEIEKTTARYIKYHGTKRATGWGQSFYEFQVLLPGVSTLTTIDLNAANTIAKVGEGIALTAAAKDQNSNPMSEIEITYEVTPADAGNVVGGKYIPAKIGEATIVAKSGEVDSDPIKLYGYTGENVALEKNVEASGYDEANNLFPSFAVDNNEGSLWSAFAGETGAERVYDAWIIVDLGAYYDLNLIALRWEGACSKAYHVDFSADKTDWRVAYNAGWDAMATHWEYLCGTVDNTKVRYVRVWSTEAVSQWGIKIMALRVYGVPWVPEGDNEKPEMGAASLESKASKAAVINVAATDNTEIKGYRVVDTTNGIDAEFTATEGQITITGLTPSTTYNFTITAIDAASNESENSANVEVTTDSATPLTAAPVPTYPADQVKSLYSNTYPFAPASLNSYNEGWWQPPVMTEGKVEENNYLLYDLHQPGMIGVQFAETSVITMEYLHVDIWASAAGTITVRPITIGGPETRKSLTLVAQQWNSFDIPMTDFAGHDWTKLFQYAIENYAAGGLVGEYIAVDNVYFYRTTAFEDTEKPSDVEVSATASYFSVTLSASAIDNSGEVNYTIKNGEKTLATGAAASGMITSITVPGLLPNTEYTLDVIVSDDKGNAADPVSITVKTAVAPAAAPVPDLNNKEVVPVFTDAVEGGPVINIGGWGQSTVVTNGQLAEGDNVMFFTNMNYLGWELTPAANATDMEYLHVDFYSIGMTQVSATPISPGHEGVCNVTLTPNTWTSVDIPLSEYAANNIEWNNIFQFKFMNPVDGNELFVDNVYFWQPVATTTVDGWGTFASAYDVQVPAGAKAYKAAYSNNGGNEVLVLTELEDGIIPAGEGVLINGAASTTYGFTSTATAPTTDMSDNDLIGTTILTDVSAQRATSDIFCLRRTELFETTAFCLYSGQYIPAGKAYLALPQINGQAGAPRNIRMVFNTATGIEDVQGTQVQSTKVIENGQLIIIRDGKRYNAQGTRVE